MMMTYSVIFGLSSGGVSFMFYLPFHHATYRPTEFTDAVGESR
jgi:hypothetical protein